MATTYGLQFIRLLRRGKDGLWHVVGIFKSEQELADYKRQHP